MALAPETVVHIPAFDTRPAWTGTLAGFPWWREFDTPEFYRLYVLMDENGYDEVRDDIETGLALLTEADLPFIFDNPHARLAD